MHHGGLRPISEGLAAECRNFYGPDRAYHEARWRFVYKLCVADCAVTPFPVPTVVQHEALQTA